MDLGLYETHNGGDLSIQNRDVWTTSTLWNQIYIALFGGNPGYLTSNNSEDSEERFDWWGNALLSDNDEYNNSQTENALKTTALNSAGRVTIEQSVKNDLLFLSKLADVTVSVSITGIDKILIEIGIKEPGEIEDKKFRILWDNTQLTPISGNESDSNSSSTMQAWILQNGVWDDLGAWFDNEYWKDN